MARCRETYSLPIDTKGKKIELACDLDEDHPVLLGNHYDKFFKLEWRHREDPTPVMATRTTPPKRAAASAAAHTSNFEVVRV